MAITILPESSPAPSRGRKAVAASAAGVLLIAGAAVYVSRAEHAASTKNSVTAGSVAARTASPRAQLVNAVRDIGSEQGVTVTFSLDTSAHGLAALLGPAGPTPTQAGAIANTELVVQAVAPPGSSLGQLGSHPDDATARFALLEHGVPMIEAVLADRRAYLRVDARTLLGLAGHSALYRQLVAESAALPAAGQALLAGRWIALPIAATGPTGADTRTELPVGAATSAATKAFGQSLANAFTVTRVSGNASGAHLRITMNTRQLITSVLGALSTATPAGALGAALTSSSAAGPNRQIVADAWIHHGLLTRVTFDLGQFASAATAGTRPHVALDLRLSATAKPIAVPAAATQVASHDLLALLSTLDQLSQH
ncbi:MAG TPA: hypothetical protein VFH54_03560 [Mycobacteriales bacterium]|nr:hypothetical protein [Mycobacteriales bacterium]